MEGKRTGTRKSAHESGEALKGGGGWRGPCYELGNGFGQSSELDCGIEALQESAFPGLLYHSGEERGIGCGMNAMLLALEVVL